MSIIYRSAILIDWLLRKSPHQQNRYLDKVSIQLIL